MKVKFCTVIISTTINSVHMMHKDSELCKYGNRCERILCMYKHKDEESILDSTTAVDKSDINKTFQNPYIIDKF